MSMCEVEPGVSYKTAESSVLFNTLVVCVQINLNSFIEKSGSECLNEQDDHPLANCLTPGSSSYLESDCDEQVT